MIAFKWRSRSTVECTQSPGDRFEFATTDRKSIWTVNIIELRLTIASTMIAAFQPVNDRPKFINHAINFSSGLFLFGNNRIHIFLSLIPRAFESMVGGNGESASCRNPPPPSLPLFLSLSFHGEDFLPTTHSRLEGVALPQRAPVLRRALRGPHPSYITLNTVRDCQPGPKSTPSSYQSLELTGETHNKLEPTILSNSIVRVIHWREDIDRASFDTKLSCHIFHIKIYIYTYHTRSEFFLCIIKIVWCLYYYRWGGMRVDVIALRKFSTFPSRFLYSTCFA